MHIYDELIATGKYEYADRGSLKLVDKKYPWSITRDEFDFIRDFTSKQGILQGYEVATGFGISALAFGLGSKEESVLITLDSYVEETYDSDGAYLNNPRQQEKYIDTVGWNSVNYLLDRYNLRKKIAAVVGVSPQDTDAVLKPFAIINYAFIDGGHSEAQILADIDSIIPWLDDSYVIFFHDGQCLTQACLDKIVQLGDLVRPGVNGWNLWYIQK